MRNAIITGSSKTSDIVGVLTGVWNEYDERGWHVVKTPFFVSLSATLQAGPQILPVTPRRAAVLSWANANNSGVIVIKAMDRNFVLPENAVVETTLFGTGE